MTSLVFGLIIQASVLTAATGATETSYAKALKDLEKTGRPLVVLVGADWCPACQVMKDTTIPKLKKSGKLKNVAFASVNVDKDEKLASKLMRGGTIPQLIVYRKTPKGWFRSQLTGAASVEKVGGVIDKAVAAQRIVLSKLAKPVRTIARKNSKADEKRQFPLWSKSQ